MLINEVKRRDAHEKDFVQVGRYGGWVGGWVVGGWVGSSQSHVLFPLTIHRQPNPFMHANKTPT